MKQKVWSERDVASAEAGSGRTSGNSDDSGFDALLQAATLAAGGEGSGEDPSCAAGVPYWWTRR